MELERLYGAFTILVWMDSGKPPYNKMLGGLSLTRRDRKRRLGIGALMIKVAVCGPMKFQDGDVSSALRDCARSFGVEEPYIREFESPIDLVDACMNVPADTEPIDLVICSVDLPGISGIQLAGESRDAGVVPHDMDVVVCASDQESAYDAYASGARGYLVEPLLQDDFDRVVGARLSQLESMRDESALMRCRTRVRRIAFSRIMYVETSGHDQLIHIVEEREPSAVRGSSKTVFELLEDDSRFFKVGSS